MADVSPVITKISPNGVSPVVHKIVVGPITNANVDSSLIDMSGLGPDRTVAITGTFDSATVVVKGSLDDTPNAIVLTDPQGNALSKTAAAIEAITEYTPYLKITSSGGGASTSVTVTIVCRRST